MEIPFFMPVLTAYVKLLIMISRKRRILAIKI